LPNGDPALTLYVVDDDARTRAELQRILAKHTALDVLAFGGPREAIEALGARPPDLALIDIRLPEMDGLALLDRVMERAPDVMAIVMTGFGEAETPRIARERGAVDFVEKPLDLPYLLVTLRQLERESRLRKNLRTAGALFTRLFEMMPDGLLMSDLEDRVLFANSLGKSLWEEGAREPGEKFTRDGRVFVLERSGSGDRRLWHWLDVTQALEKERFSAYRQMARFLAHELRNPLTPMRLWLQELQGAGAQEARFPEMVGEAVSVLLGQVERLMGLVDRLKALGEQAPPVLTAVGVRPVAVEVLRALAPLAAKRGLALTEPSEGQWTALAEEGGLYQLLFNLVRNALEAPAAGGGRVSLAVEESGGEVLITVEDRGGGLPPEVASAPFTPYLTTKEGGTGLGLLICRELASRMGGRLEIENREGLGVTARVALPKA
jgi:signal transduction histidine kinase